jgi:hypothetical protein
VKERPRAFLAEIFQEPQPYPVVADYIQELHEYLWRFVRAEFPFASGTLSDYVKIAVQSAEYRATKSPLGSRTPRTAGEEKE